MSHRNKLNTTTPKRSRIKTQEIIIKIWLGYDSFKLLNLALRHSSPQLDSFINSALKLIDKKMKKYFGHTCFIKILMKEWKYKII